MHNRWIDIFECFIIRMLMDACTGYKAYLDIKKENMQKYDAIR